MIPSLLIVCGLEREAALARAPHRVTLVSGGEPERLARQLGTMDPSDFSAVISFGVAGGLDPVLTAGAVLIPDMVVDAVGARWSADESVAGLLRAKLPGASRGALAGVGSPVLDPAGKAALRRRTGAAAVDMESHIAAAFAAGHGIPFAALRTVSDPAGRSLPPLARVALDADGRLAWRAILKSLIAQPAQLTLLPGTARDARRGFAALGQAAQALLAVAAGL